MREDILFGEASSPSPLYSYHLLSCKSINEGIQPDDDDDWDDEDLPEPSTREDLDNENNIGGDSDDLENISSRMLQECRKVRELRLPMGRRLAYFVCPHHRLLRIEEPGLALPGEWGVMILDRNDIKVSLEMALIFLRELIEETKKYLEYILASLEIELESNVKDKIIVPISLELLIRLLRELKNIDELGLENTIQLAKTAQDVINALYMALVWKDIQNREHRELAIHYMDECKTALENAIWFWGFEELEEEARDSQCSLIGVENYLALFIGLEAQETINAVENILEALYS